MNTLVKNINTQRRWLLKAVALPLCALLLTGGVHAQKDFVGDGFGGRLWYKPSNISLSITAVATNGLGTMNIKGQVYMWGSIGSGAAGPGTATNIATPLPIAKPYAAINKAGQPLNGSLYAYLYPQAISSLNNVNIISLNSYDGAAVKKDGSLWIWAGNSGDGQTGLGASTSGLVNQTPLMIMPPGSGCVQVRAGSGFITFLKADGTVWSLGKNEAGQFGNGIPTTTVSLTPVQMMGITNAKRIGVASSGGNHDVFVLKADHTVWHVGGYKAGDFRFTPVQIAGLPNDIIDIQEGAVFLTAGGDVWIPNNLPLTGSELFPYATTYGKVVFPAGAKKIVGVVNPPWSWDYYALDENHNLYYGLANRRDDIGTYDGMGRYDLYNHEPEISAHYVDNMTSSGQMSYLQRTTDFPSDHRLWGVNTFGVFKLNDETYNISKGKDTADAYYDRTTSAYGGVRDWSYGNAIYPNDNGFENLHVPFNIWLQCNPSGIGLGGFIEDTTAGTVDCSKTQLYPAPKAGTANQVSLIVTVNITKAGCFPLTVSGSGFSLTSSTTQICTSTTGIQQFHIPVNYDGSTLGTLTFTVGQAGTCTADLGVAPKKKVVDLWTLDNCTLVNAPPALK